jgi:hypothetical protein
MDASDPSRREAAKSWLGRFPGGRARGAGGPAVPGGTDAAAVSVPIVTDISRVVALPGYAAAARSPTWAPRGAGRRLSLARDAVA